jgi:hypothetical protein
MAQPVHLDEAVERLAEYIENYVFEDGLDFLQATMRALEELDQQGYCFIHEDAIDGG